MCNTNLSVNFPYAKLTLLWCGDLRLPVWRLYQWPLRIVDGIRRRGAGVWWFGQWRTTRGGSPTRSSWVNFAGHNPQWRWSHAWSGHRFLAVSVPLPPRSYLRPHSRAGSCARVLGGRCGGGGTADKVTQQIPRPGQYIKPSLGHCTRFETANSQRHLQQVPVNRCLPGSLEVCRWSENTGSPRGYPRRTSHCVSNTMSGKFYWRCW